MYFILYCILTYNVYMNSKYVCMYIIYMHTHTHLCVSPVFKEISITPALSNTRPVTTVNLHSILYIQALF